ncbi:DUF4192 domain-containing protein [Arthrobacter koreensis]|uniref:DUF4192 domain-containing protein n=1 Tax=Arthrobacter koreensis TaxID=199136 RepID=A0ABY6FVU3_9MICC|nr:DUF4192 domain-containing protein [Arthrobacter koreensis]UYB37354.1 DUF4192 domain-containing protein [Arthrobacter koreensis]
MSEFQNTGRPDAGRQSAPRRHHPAADTADGGPGADGAGAGTTEVLRAGTPQDILAFVPHCLGFTPQESLVLLGLRGARLGATLRLDLPGASCAGDSPGLDSLELISGYADRITSLLSNDEDTDGVLAVLYTNLVPEEGTPPPYSALMDILCSELERHGLIVRDAWLTGNGTWRAYFCTDPGCCPWPGHPTDGIAGSRLGAELVYRGSAFAPSLEGSLEGTLRRAGTLRTAAMDARIGEVRRRMEGRWGSPDVFDEVLAAWDRRMCSATRLPPSEPVDPNPGRNGHEGDALLLASLECKPVRDAVLVLAASGMAAAAQGIRHVLHPDLVPDTPNAGQEPSALAGQQFRSMLIGRSRSAPDWERLDAVHSVFCNLLLRAAGEPAAALLTLLGWVEWARGRSSRAELSLSAALREVPGYRLAALLRELLRRGELPQWALSPLTAWHGGPGA